MLRIQIDFMRYFALCAQYDKREVNGATKGGTNLFVRLKSHLHTLETSLKHSRAGLKLVTLGASGDLIATSKSDTRPRVIATNRERQGASLV